MAGAYFDSGILVKIYCHEPDSDEALTLVGGEPPGLPLTHLQEAELRNALRLKVFRKELTAAFLQTSLALLDEDIHQGRWERPIYDLAEVYRQAEFLSARHAATTGARTLDILHVATALELGAGRFVSLDQRQRVVAKKAGLKVIPMTDN